MITLKEYIEENEIADMLQIPCLNLQDIQEATK